MKHAVGLQAPFTQRRRRRLLGLGAAGFVLVAQALVGVAPAAAAPQLFGNLVFQNGSSPPIPRAPGSAVTAVQLTATEGASFQLSASAPFAIVPHATDSCQTTWVTSCTYDGITRTVTLSTDGGAEDVVGVIIRFSLAADATLPQSSQNLSVTATPIAPTTGNPGAAVDPTTPIVSNPATEAAISLTTLQPTGTPSAPRNGATVPFEVRLDRTGFLGQPTDVDVALVADTGLGTSAGANETVAFPPGTTTATATIEVTVPPAASLGTASYHFTATYDPTTTDGIPLDVVTGAPASFTITDPPPVVVLPDTPAGDSVAPETTLTRAPKAKLKSKKKKAKAAFEFSSSEAGSGFECRLDDEPPAPCTSPLMLKVKRGRHTFEVVAIDAAGNRDSSPATASFKVVRKKKRRG